MTSEIRSIPSVRGVRHFPSLAGRVPCLPASFPSSNPDPERGLKRILLHTVWTSFLVLGMPAIVLFGQTVDAPGDTKNSRFSVIERDGIYAVTVMPDGPYASYDELPRGVRLQRETAGAAAGNGRCSRP